MICLWGLDTFLTKLIPFKILSELFLSTVCFFCSFGVFQIL